MNEKASRILTHFDPYFNIKDSLKWCPLLYFLQKPIATYLLWLIQTDNKHASLNFNKFQTYCRPFNFQQHGIHNIINTYLINLMKDNDFSFQQLVISCSKQPAESKWRSVFCYCAERNEDVGWAAGDEDVGWVCFPAVAGLTKMQTSRWMKGKCINKDRFSMAMLKKDWDWR